MQQMRASLKQAAHQQRATQSCWQSHPAPGCRRRSSSSVMLPATQRRVRAGAAEQPDKVSFEQLFATELANRQAVEAKAAEREAAAVFDGAALLDLLRNKYKRSYDVSLVRRTYLGKVFVALNIMWKYREQQSFAYTEEEYMQRLEFVAAALVAWNAVTSVQSQIAATKERPRVGKAVSIMLDVPEERAREFIGTR